MPGLLQFLQTLDLGPYLFDQAGRAFSTALEFARVPLTVTGQRYEVFQEAGRNQQTRQHVAEFVEKNPDIKNLFQALGIPNL